MEWLQYYVKNIQVLQLVISYEFKQRFDDYFFGFVYLFLSFSRSAFILSGVSWNKFLLIALKILPLVIIMFLHEPSRQLLV